jgi:hypothetical protein
MTRIERLEREEAAASLLLETEPVALDRAA